MSLLRDAFKPAFLKTELTREPFSTSKSLGGSCWKWHESCKQNQNKPKANPKQTQNRKGDNKAEEGELPKEKPAAQQTTSPVADCSYCQRRACKGPCFNEPSPWSGVRLRAKGSGKRKAESGKRKESKRSKGPKARTIKPIENCRVCQTNVSFCVVSHLPKKESAARKGRSKQRQHRARVSLSTFPHLFPFFPLHLFPLFPSPSPSLPLSTQWPRLCGVALSVVLASCTI